MRWVTLLASCVLATLPFAGALAADDALLRKVIRAYNIKPHVPAVRHYGPKERLGQALFFDPFISGPKSIACATCHVRSLGAGDGLPVAIGVGGTGVAKERTRSPSGFVVPRNAMPFFNRGSSEFVAFFWDGRIQRGRNGRFESPLGNHLPGGFESLLAVTAVFPLAEPDEMLGRRASVAGSRAYHGELVSGDVDDENYQARTRSVFANLIDRVLAPSDTTPEQVVIRYRELFHTAYPNVTLSQLNITHFGNALAAYIAAAFELQPARWDRYVTGDNKALTAEDKHGALLFYGKGRCAVCHAGTQFSDFRFHGLAIPQQRIGKHGAYLDYGRASATSRGADRFAFRTPPLRNVTLTGPWGHNGYFTSLKAIIAHHADPIPELYAAQQRSGTADQSGRLIGFRSPILAEMPPLSTKEIERLVRFLGSLTSQTVMTDEDALPADVPSGNRQFIRR